MAKEGARKRRSGLETLRHCFKEHLVMNPLNKFCGSNVTRSNSKLNHHGGRRGTCTTITTNSSSSNSGNQYETPLQASWFLSLPPEAALPQEWHMLLL